MEWIRDIHKRKNGAGAPVVSIEFFPPKTPEGERTLLERTIPELKRIEPDYFSVTYGAGGSTRDSTLRIVDQIQRDHGITGMAHLTCVNATREEIGAVLEEARGRGIRNILALRGDPPGGASEFVRTEGGFEYSHELVTFIRDAGGFSIGTAGFPEGHIACREGKHRDWDRLKAKIDCGADFVLTQLFYDNRDYFEFRDYMTTKHRVTIPICPGILPILGTAQIKRFTTLCGARLPDALLARLEAMGDDAKGVREMGIEIATRQCEELLREGVSGLHLYSLNKSYSVLQIAKNLGLGSLS